MSWHLYAAAWAERNGGYDLRRAPTSVRAWLRVGYALARGLASLRVPVGAVFVATVLLAAAVPAAAAASTASTAEAGSLGLLTAAGLVVASAFAHTVDSALTLLTASDPTRAAIRSVLAARLSEISWLTAFWVVGVPGAVVIACGGLTVLYEFARQEALAGGMTRVGVQTVADRPMRVWVAALGLLLAGLANQVGLPIEAGLLAVAAIGWLVLAVIGAGQLTTAVRRSLP